jgi:hypothetical protein
MRFLLLGVTAMRGLSAGSFQPHGHGLWNAAGNVREARRQLRSGTYAARAAGPPVHGPVARDEDRTAQQHR